MRRRTRLAPTPRIRTKTITAANLLRKIRDLILDEPKRMGMDAFILAFKNDCAKDEPEHFPACGTIGCIAGWGAILLRKEDKAYPLEASKTMSTALTGYSYFMGPDRLFSPSHLVEFGEHHKSDILARPGTARHARGVARRINLFLERHPEMETRVIQVRP